MPAPDPHAMLLPDLQTSGDLIADRRFTYALALLNDKDGTAAKDLLDQVLERVPHWPPALLALGDACLLVQDEQGAVNAFSACLADDPSDRLGAGPRLARLQQIPPDHAIRPAYVAALFDDYAKRFDQHLLETLDYSAPQQINAALSGYGAQYERAYDLGCGTGLMGDVLRPYSRWLGGCDLSAAMLNEAKRKALYDHLDHADCIEALERYEAQTYDLVTAADVLVYIGALNSVFHSVQRVLKPSGLFAFTTQACEGDGFIIGADLRAAHSQTYVIAQAQAARLDCLTCQPVSVRKDRDQPVAGWLCLLRPHQAV